MRISEHTCPKQIETGAIMWRPLGLLFPYCFDRSTHNELPVPYLLVTMDFSFPYVSFVSF